VPNEKKKIKGKDKRLWCENCGKGLKKKKKKKD